MDPRLRVRPVRRVDLLHVIGRGGRLVHHHHHGHQVVIVRATVARVVIATVRSEPVGPGIERIVRPETSLPVRQSGVDKPPLLSLLLLLLPGLLLRLPTLKLSDLIRREIQNLLLGEPCRVQAIQESIEDLGREGDILRVDVDISIAIIIVRVEGHVRVQARVRARVRIGPRTEVRIERVRAERVFPGVGTLGRLVFLCGELFLEDRHEFERSRRECLRHC